MIVQNILDAKGTQVHTIGPDATLAEVVHHLVRDNVGSLVVCECDWNDTYPAIIGIITERDILRTIEVHNVSLERLTVADVMSTELITASPRDPVDHVMWLMTENRIRHVPIVAEGQLHGMISIGDVIKAQLDEMKTDRYYLYM